LPDEWWHTNTDILSSFGVNANPVGYNFLRPDNYYLAGGASQMINSLTAAFARISVEVRSSASSVAANSTRVDTDTAVFQAAFDSHRWSGEVLAFRINDEAAASTPAWNAADALNTTAITNRKIFTVTPPAAAAHRCCPTPASFQWAPLDSAADGAETDPRRR
jgi:type IV pilus assembly protein PilY1